MNIEALLFFVVSAVFAIGMLFSGLNRIRDINKEVFEKNNKFLAHIKDGDEIDFDAFKKSYIILHFCLFTVYLLLIIISYVALGGSIIDLSQLQVQYVITGANAIVVFYVLRIYVLHLLRNKYTTRKDVNYKARINISYLILGVVFTVVFFYNLYLSNTI